MRKRGHPGYWLMAALFGGATLGLLYLAGVDEPLRDPWSALVTVAAVVGAEIVASDRLGWTGPQSQADPERAARSNRIAATGIAGAFTWGMA